MNVAATTALFEQGCEPANQTPSAFEGCKNSLVQLLYVSIVRLRI